MNESPSRLKKAKLNIIWSFTQQIVNFICGMILPPLIILTYGSAYNGIVASIKQFLSLVSILRLGIAGAVRVALYKPLAENDTERVSTIVKATDRYMWKVSIVILVYVIILTLAYPLYAVPEYRFSDVAVLVLALGVGTFAEYFFGFTYTQLLDADQQAYISNILNTIITVIVTVISVLLIYGGFSLQTIKIVSAILFFSQLYLLKAYVSKKYNIENDIAPDDTALKARRDSIWHSIANIVHDNTDIITLTLFTDIKIVSVYSVYRIVCAGIGQIITAGTTGTEALFGNMWANEETENIRRSMELFEYFISAFVSIILSVTGLLILPFIALYTKGADDVEYIVPLYAVLIVVAYGVYCFELPYRIIIQAAGHYHETKNGRFIQAIINLVFTLLLVRPFGLIGTAIGTLCANLFGMAQYMRYTYMELVKIEIRNGILRIAWAIMNALLIYFVCIGFVGRFAYIGWQAWALCGIGCVGAGIVIFVVSSCVFYRKDAICAINILFKITGKKFRRIN